MSGICPRLAAVSRYDWLLFLHLLGAFAAMGSVVVFSVLVQGLTVRRVLVHYGLGHQGARQTAGDMPKSD